MIPRALTIAGSDSGGGAGIQADLKTFHELGVYGMSALTAVTVQNTQGVYGIYDIPSDGITAQIKAVAEDIGLDGVKTGMLSKPEVIESVAQVVKELGLPHLVVDPVMVAKGGSPLLVEEAQEVLREVLLPLAEVVTPNLPEAEVLTGMRIEHVEAMEEAAQFLHERYGVGHVVIKGGHLTGEALDVYYDGKRWERLSAERFPTLHTHGTGCTFSAALTAELAKGNSVLESVKTAKRFITAAIETSLGLGKGHGPTNHWAFRVKEKGDGRGL